MNRLDRRAIGHAHSLAATSVSAVGMCLGMWAGRGDYATLSDDARDHAGQRALAELDQAITAITAVRDRLAEALRPPAAEPGGEGSTGSGGE